MEGITIRRSTIADAAALNSRLLATWSNPPFGHTAWEFWHKDALLHPNTDFAVLAEETATGRIVGSCISRFRGSDFLPEHAEDLSLSEDQKVLVGWDKYSKDEQANINSFMQRFSLNYQQGAREVLENGYLPPGRPYLYVRQMGVDEAFQGKGLGGMLLKMILEEATRRGCAVQLESWGKGKAFYRKYGATEAGNVYPLNFNGEKEAAQSCMVWYAS
ncbi:hypothetical protein HK405_002289 [Cladochytrium tenue]|nr:hypothetical protein HK405_002289 [Cladochytrium tenue]